MNVEIRKIVLEDTKNIVKWRNSPDVKLYLYSQEELTEEQHIAYFNNYIVTGKVVQFIITADKVDCGTAFLKNINMKEKTAEFGIFIGISSFRGKGISSIVTRKVIEYGFTSLGLVQIYLTVLKTNIAAIKSYEKAGFIKTKVMEKGYSRDGCFFDVIEMRIDNSRAI